MDIYVHSPCFHMQLLSARVPLWPICDPVKECTCSATAIIRYQKRISGPLLDRIDIHVEVPCVDYEKLADKRQVENSETIRKRVQAARERQLQRFKGTKSPAMLKWGQPRCASFARSSHPPKN